MYSSHIKLPIYVHLNTTLVDAYTNTTWILVTPNSAPMSIQDLGPDGRASNLTI